jgi:hypothetical protein
VDVFFSESHLPKTEGIFRVWSTSARGLRDRNSVDRG